MSADFVHTSGRLVQSPVTGRQLWVNDDPERALVPPTADRVELARLCAACDAPEVEDLGLTVAADATEAEVLAFLSVLVGTLKVPPPLKQRSSAALQAFVMGLWTRGMLALPPSMTHWCRPVWRTRPQDAGVLHARLLEVEGTTAAGTKGWVLNAVAAVWRMHLMVCGIKDWNDLTARTHGLSLLREHDWVNAARTVEKLRGTHGRQLSDDDRLWTKNYKANPRRDPAFAWAVDQDASLSEWASALGAWMLSLRGKQPYVAANKFVAYLLEHSELPRHPAQFCRHDFRPALTFADYASLTCTHVHALVGPMRQFFDWLLDTRLTLPAEEGRRARDPDLVQPLASAQAVKQSQSVRDAMPTRYVRDLLAVLTDDNWAWARTLKRDYVKVKCPETNTWNRVWSPVRAMAIVLKLLLPLRTFQVRMLASDEGDPRQYIDGAWVDVEQGRSEIAGTRRTARACQGFLREFEGFTGFYVNTNKTHDADSREGEGYEIPWQHERAIALVAELMAWQKTYNPSVDALPWSDVDDSAFRQRRDERALKLAGAAHFLFRDPVHDTDRRQPVTDAALRKFWSQLLTEYERRLAASGKTDALGGPIRLVVPAKTSSGMARAVFDLHCLRVTLLTSLAVEGRVPMWVLSKFLAGHSTVLMTLYYIKAGSPHINAQLRAAEEKIEDEEQANYLRYLQSQERQAVQPMVALNHPCALDVLKNPRTYTVGRNHLGICPADGGLCKVGGPLLHELEGIHGEVPGGPGNCVRCRFFVTGVPWLAGLVAHFNAITVRLRSLAPKAINCTRAMEALEQDMRQAGQGATKALHQRLAEATSNYDRAVAALDHEERNWQATHRLIERCREIAAQSSAGPVEGPGLLPAGTRADIEVAVQECSTFALFDTVCQSARWFPGEDITEAQLRRSSSLDALLTRNGRPAYFAHLTDAEALQVGNAMTWLLRAEYSAEAVERMVAGAEALPARGALPQLDALLQRHDEQLPGPQRAMRPLPTDLRLLGSTEVSDAA